MSQEKSIQQPIDFHCHGVGRFDFTDLSAIDLNEIDLILKSRNQRSILTIYLPKPEFHNFLKLIDKYHVGYQNGQYQNIAGFGLEGPLLASHGGTPEQGVWLPEKHHWKSIAQCGQKGLIYTIYSPDAFLPGSNFYGQETDTDITWITETLLEGGVLPAPGHFTKDNPQASANELQKVIDAVKQWGHSPMITDHLYNDMPHNFKHAWRTPEEKLVRDQEIARVGIENWSLDTLEEDIGIIPAMLIKNARAGIIKICQNFDGEHVDLEVIKKTVNLLGAENMLMMTDSIESKRLAGRDLHLNDGSTLLYQDDNIVAAGSLGVDQQVKNMVSIGLSAKEISMITQENPNKILQHRDEYINACTHEEAVCF